MEKKPARPSVGSHDEIGLERAIAGALRATISDHGPITPALIGSAAKRVIGNLRNAQLGGVVFEDVIKRRSTGTSSRSAPRR